MGVVVMSQSEQRRYNQAMEVIHGRLSIDEFATLNNFSYRHARRVVKKVRDKGMMGVKHGNTGRIPANKTTSDNETDVLNLLKNKYFDFNLTHFREKIIHDENLSIGKNVIHRIATKNGLVKRAKRRPLKKVHSPRARMPQEGMLLQFDGSRHIWFNNFECDLIGGIDDATGKVIGAEFFIGETSINCMKVMSDIVAEKGVPHSIYLDQAGAFGKDDRDQCSTQIGRALKEIGCYIILANSPQAKGKIERLWNTFQDRLIPELRLNNITSIPQANKYLKEVFIPKFNQQFSYPARDATLAYRTMTKKTDSIFCIKDQRKVSMANTFSWKGDTYIIDEYRNYRFRTVNICIHLDGKMSFNIMGQSVQVKMHTQHQEHIQIAA